MLLSLSLLLIAAIAFISGWKRAAPAASTTGDVRSLVSSTKDGYQRPLGNAIKATALSLAALQLTPFSAVADGKNLKKPKILETDNGIKYIMLKQGSGNYPATGDFVVFDFIGFLSNGTVFDSTETKGRKPLGFRFGKKQVIPGIESVLSYMQPGGEATCTVPPEFAYGTKGVCLESGECIVPPNETLKYVLKLKTVGAGYN